MAKRLSVERWDEILRRYVGGREPAKRLARQYGVSESAVYKRAARGGWADSIDRLVDSAHVVDETLIARLESAVDRIEEIIGGAHGRAD